MSEFFKQFNDILKKDELIGGDDTPLEMNNINVAQDAVLKRGDLLSADNFQDTFKLAAASDTAKVFAVSVKDFTASEDKQVTQGYISGRFNRQRLRVASSDTATVLTTLEPAMRRQEIKLSELKRGTSRNIN